MSTIRVEVPKTVFLGDRPTPTLDVLWHEIGHALDDLDGPGEEMISDQLPWRAVYDTCLPYLTSPSTRFRGRLVGASSWPILLPPAP